MEARIGCRRDHVSAVHSDVSTSVRNIRCAKIEWLLFHTELIGLSMS